MRKVISGELNWLGGTVGYGLELGDLMVAGASFPLDMKVDAIRKFRLGRKSSRRIFGPVKLAIEQLAFVRACRQ